MTMFKKITLGSVSLALVATPFAPIMAADLGMAKHSAVSVQDQTVITKSDSNDYRRRYRRHHDRVDAGDVIAGIGILAGIAIIADAASKAKQRDRDVNRYPQEYPQSFPQNNPYPQDNRQSTPDRDDRNVDFGNDGNNDLGDAVTACSREAESRSGRNARVEEIRSVTRDGNAWRVEGRVSGGDAESFSCGATAGRVDYFRYNT